MNDTGQDMRATLLAGSDDVPPGIDLLRGVQEQAAARHRHRRRVRVLVPAGAVAAAGGVAAATLLGMSVTSPPSALAAVTSAMVKTSAQSYRFILSLSVRLREPAVVQHVLVTGAFDPRHERGAELLTGRSPIGTHVTVTAQLRIIGKDLYTWASPKSVLGSIGKPWDEAPIPAGLPGYAAPGSELSGNAFERPISPAGLLGVLRSAAAVRYVGPASGPGWTGSEYAFTAHPGFLDTVAGTVYVDQQGRVRGLATITTLRIAGLSTPSRTETEDLTFADFGGPVRVTAPPASQVKQTSTPFWVFGF